MKNKAKKMPQRRTHKSMTGGQMLDKISSKFKAPKTPLAAAMKAINVSKKKNIQA